MQAKDSGLKMRHLRVVANRIVVNYNSNLLVVFVRRNANSNFYDFVPHQLAEMVKFALRIVLKEEQNLYLNSEPNWCVW